MTKLTTRPADFLAKKPMLDPMDLSTIARQMLTLPTSALEAIAPVTKRICSICTTDDIHPVLMDEGAGEVLHKQSRGHRKRVQRLNRETTQKQSLQSNPGLAEIAESQ